MSADKKKGQGEDGKAAEPKRTNEELKQEAQDWLTRQGYTFRLSTMSWQCRGDGVGPNHLQGLLAFSLRATPQRLNPVMASLTQDAIDTALENGREWLERNERLVPGERRAREAPLRRLLKIVQRQGTAPDLHEAHVVIMRQFFWQVKRNLASQKVINHIVPVFWSREQSSGKSTLLEKFCAPLNDFLRKMSVNDLGKSFSGPLLAQARIVNFDEFAGAQKAEAALLKTILTGADFNERAIYSAVGFSGRNRLSCIGSSNLRPPHGFVDETGGRRFWPIHVDWVKPTDWNDKGQAINAISATNLWASVSVTEDSPLGRAPAELQGLIERMQELHVRTRSSLSQYIDECVQYCEGQAVDLRALRPQYVGWCRETGLSPVTGSKETFGKHLEDLGLVVTRGKNIWRLKHHIMSSEQMVLP